MGTGWSGGLTGDAAKPGCPFSAAVPTVLTTLPAHAGVLAVRLYRRYLTDHTRPCPRPGVSCSIGAELLLQLPDGRRRAAEFVKGCRG